MFDSGETRTMIDRTSRYMLLKYFSDGCTAIYLSQRFLMGGGEGGETRDKKRLRLFSRHLRESHRYRMGHWYIGRVSIVTKSAGTHRTYQWRVNVRKRIELPAVRRGDPKVKRAAKHFHFPAGFRTTTRRRSELRHSLVSPVKSEVELIRFVPRPGIWESNLLDFALRDWPFWR